LGWYLFPSHPGLGGFTFSNPSPSYQHLGYVGLEGATASRY
jgi:hypothetical protein